MWVGRETVETSHQFWIDVRKRSWPSRIPMVSTSVEEAEDDEAALALLKVTFEFRQDLYTPALLPVAPALLELLVVSQRGADFEF